MALNSQASDLLAEHAGVTLSQWRVISFVGTGDAVTSRGVAASSGLDPAVVSRAIRALEERGLLDVERLKEDRRTLALTLTPEGLAVFERTVPLMHEREADLLNALTPDEQAMIRAALEKLEMAAVRRDFGD